MDGAPADQLVFGVERSLSGKRWLERGGDARLGLALAQATGLPEIVGRLLAARGIDANGVESYLDPKLGSLLPDPAHLLGMDAAVERLCTAIASGEGIAVFGDYDVDGATSSAILVRYFRSLGIEIEVYIPDRMREGYGPNEAALGVLKAKGASVVITVDCGTTAYAALSAAREMGLDVIVADHHVAEAGLPEAIAVINPNRMDDASPHGQLAAVGVTFLLVVGLNRALRGSGYFKTNNLAEPNLMQWLDLVALGTVADVVPLTGVNRALVVQGLKILARRQNPGLVALSDIAGIDEAPSAYHLGFVLGPRVNAGGRVGESNLGVRLLATDDDGEAREIAARLNDHNVERRAIENAIQSAATEQIDEHGVGAMVIAIGEGWHAGVIGIIASRLRERYNKPAFVIAINDGGCTGSGRSISGFDLGASVIAARQKGLIEKGGGHAMAAGFSCLPEQLEGFKAFMEGRAARHVAETGFIPTLNIDANLRTAGASLELIRQLERLGPFGSGNREPRFAFSSLRVAKADVVGKDHVRCFLADQSGARLAAIAFRQADTELGKALLDRGGLSFHVAGKLRENSWQGRTSVQLLIDDAAAAQ
ncbi:MAG: single-stranded-DNA-specific exonuclease RecJ [Rhodospirillales bacterium]|nr:single-stranded-DNA-specific exonuclease RecJ [Rhodospirillales bacterium]